MREAAAWQRECDHYDRISCDLLGTVPIFRVRIVDRDCG